MLKPLSRALAAGDSIRCVVREGTLDGGEVDGVPLDDGAGFAGLVQRALALQDPGHPRREPPKHFDAPRSLMRTALAAWPAPESSRRAGRRCHIFVKDHPLPSYPVRVRQQEQPPPPKVAFVFAGAGSAWWGMARELMGSEPVFRSCFQSCDAAFRTIGGWSLVEALFAPLSRSGLARGAVQLPVVLGIQISLAALWRDWGIEPGAVMGFSAGEWAAAHVAGILSLEEAFALAHHFLQVLRDVFGGAGMAVVGLPAAQVAHRLGAFSGRVAIASENSPVSTGIGGEPAALQALTEQWRAEGVFARMVDIDVYGHIPQVEPLMAHYLRECPALKPLPGRIPMLSTVTGAIADGPSMGPSYWADHIRKPVRFSSAVQALLESGHEVFLDVNPHPIHARSVEEHFAGRPGGACVIASMLRGEDAQVTLHRALTALLEKGCVAREERVVPLSHVPAALEGPAELFVLSSRTEQMLREQARRVAEQLREQDGASLLDLCFTAALGRDHHEHRLALVASSRRSLAEGLAAFARRESLPIPSAQGVVRPGSSVRVGFVFPGQECFPLGQSAALLEEPCFRECFERCEWSLRSLTGASLIQSLQSGQVQPDVGPPLLFAFQVSLAALWSAWGIHPDGVVGQGVGEVSAAHVAGGLSLEDGMALVVGHARARASLAPSVPLYSARRGGRLRAADLDPVHWRECLGGQRTVFESAVEAMLADGLRAFVELAPRPVLSHALRRLMDASGLAEGRTAVCSAHRDGPPRGVLLETLGMLHTLGREPRWKGLFSKGGRMTKLPPQVWRSEHQGFHAARGPESGAPSTPPPATTAVRSAGRVEPIAVVGMSCRLPGGVRSPEDFWRLLSEGGNAVREVPPDRWNLEAWYDADPEAPGKMYSRHGGFLDDVDAFDASFFGVSRVEARSMDPQQRMLLELSWEALESAGLAVERLQGSATGVFVGICLSDYAHLELHARDPRGINAYSGSGSVHSVAAGRIAYALGLEGPAVAVDTACSSSLVAAHLACQSLREGECDLALVGGASLLLSPRMSVYFSKLRVLSADGACRAFDHAASGYVRGEGAGVVVLKRLSDALMEGAPILGVLRGSAVSQGGRSNGLTAPSGPSQARVIERALRQGGVAPLEVGYVEAHGTGTSLGDAIEVESLASVLGQGRPRSAPLWLGSVKTNLGHLEGSAGIASLLKVLLALRHRALPKNLHFDTPSPYIPWSEIPIQVVTELREWQVPPGGRRVAGVSAFGFSGTNAHLVVEEAPPCPRRAEVSEDAERPELLVLSARDPEALRESAERFHAMLMERDGPMRDVCYSASCRRSHHEHRLAVVARSRSEAAEALDAFRRGPPPAKAHVGFAPPGDSPGVVFLFNGLGAPWSDAGWKRLEEEPAFRESLRSVDEVLTRLSGQSILEEPGREPPRPEGTCLSGPAHLALQLSLVALLRSWGIEPGAVLGVGLGEVAAAYVAGVLSLEDAVRLCLADDAAGAKEVSARLPVLPIYSSVRGARAVVGDFEEDHWKRDMHSPARLESALEAVAGDGHTLFVELGSEASLSSVVQACLQRQGKRATVLTALRRGEPERRSLLSVLGGLFVEGVSPEWARLFPEGGAWVPLPSYPWRKERYWVSTPEPELPVPMQEERGLAPAVLAGLVAAAPEAVRLEPAVLPPLHELVQLPPEQRRACVETFLRGEVATLLELSGDLPDGRQPLVRFGFDSLMGMKLKARLAQTLGLTVSAVLLLSGMSLDGLVKLALENLDALPPRPEVATNDSMEEFRF
ncbi:acyltransferase domain-containing protein [Myxococcus stipitatus]|uniref:acyltransferase domain-containing protein n=1 Tax=Myxococcus stipitatus TaxID=83455 RepID=UPI0030D4C416